MSTRTTRLVWLVRGGMVVAAIGVVAVGALLGGDRTVSFGKMAAVQFSGDARVVTLPQFGERGSHILSYQHGQTITFTIPLKNDSRLPVSIASIDLGNGPLPLLVVERAAVGADELPVTVPAGDTAPVTVTARFGNCRYFHEREVQTFSKADVRARALGLNLNRQVALDHDLVVHSPMIIGCPDRTLDRNDDRRPRTVHA